MIIIILTAMSNTKFMMMKNRQVAIPAPLFFCAIYHEKRI